MKNFRGTLRVRATLLAAAFGCVLSLGMFGPSKAQADICTPDPAFGSCANMFRLYPGEFPYAMTVSESESRLIVADLFSGQFFKLEISDLTQPIEPDPLPAPVGPATYTGVAWHPTEDRLYWLVEGGVGPRLVISTSGGSLVSDTMITGAPAGGFLSGLTYKPDTDTFWTSDIVGDQYLELDAMGVTTGATFTSPGLTQFGGDAYGLGLTAVLESEFLTSYLLDVSIGTPNNLRTARVERMRPNGDRAGLFYGLDNTTELTGWITGMAWTPMGSTGAPTTFFADLTANQIVEVPTPFITAASVIDVSCSADAANNVTVNWMNPVTTYTSISVLRDGAVIASVGGGDQTYTDNDVDAGTHVYEIQPFVASGEELPAGSCEVVVGFGRFLNATSHVGTEPFAITVIESSNQVLVADLASGQAHLYSKDLVAAGTMIPSPFSAPELTSGVAWNSTDDTLLWHNGDGQIQKTDLLGAPIGAAATLSPLPPEPTGDISYSPLNNTYYGVSISGGTYFEFQEDGTVLSNCSFPNVNGLPGAFSQGVAVVPNATSVILDVPIGPVNGASANRVRRLLDCSDSGLEYGTEASTLSGALAGIAWTAAGSTGLVSEYLVGFDTGSIYEVSLDLSSVGDDFQRGDVNVDGVRDISDATTILLNLFGSGSGFLCVDGADANDDGGVDVADAVTLLTFLFEGGLAIAAPFDCGEDPTMDSATCDSYPICP